MRSQLIESQGFPTERLTKKWFKMGDGGDFCGGAVDKNPLANAGDTGSIPGLGRSHMPWSS